MLLYVTYVTHVLRKLRYVHENRIRNSCANRCFFVRLKFPCRFLVLTQAAILGFLGVPTLRIWRRGVPSPVIAPEI